MSLAVTLAAHAEEPPAAQLDLGHSAQDPGARPKAAPTVASTDATPAPPSTRRNAVDTTEAPNSFAGSVFIFDQSILASDMCPSCQLSPSPLYEWWFSPRVYYTFAQHWRLGARFDFFQEVGTNHEETTNAHELVLGDPWLTGAYRTPLFNDHPHSRTRSRDPWLIAASHFVGPFFAS